MKNIQTLAILALLVSLSACSSMKTNETVFHKGNKTITCGGNYAGFALGGIIGRDIQERNYDSKCVDDAHKKGYTN